MEGQFPLVIVPQATVAITTKLLVFGLFLRVSIVFAVKSDWSLESKASGITEMGDIAKAEVH